MDFKDTQNGFFANNAGVHKTTNGSNTWSLTSLTGNYLDVFYLGGDTAIATSINLMKLTTDNGNTWNNIYIQNPMGTICGKHLNKLFRFSNSSLFISTNGGSVWTSLPLPESNCTSGEFFDNNFGVASFPTGNIYFTRNGGYTWTNSPIPSDFVFNNILIIDTTSILPWWSIWFSHCI